MSTNFKHNKNWPVFSVVIPVYNKEPHVARAIRSVLAQTFQNFELILINDASTDNSLGEMQKFSDPRIRILNRDKSGPGGYAARNLGTAEARSEWVAFLDADDKWFSGHLERYVALAEEFPDDSVFGCGWEIVDPHGVYGDRFLDSYYVCNSEKGNHRLTFEKYLGAAVAERRPICTSVACIKKTLLQSAGGFPAGKAQRGGDVETWLRCVERAGGIAWSSHVGAVYYRDAFNMVTRTRTFLAEVERETVRNLLPKYPGSTGRLLKLFANQRTISAWKESNHTEKKQKFVLFRKLYLAPDILKNTPYLLFSLLPPSVFLFVQSRVRACKLAGGEKMLRLKMSRFGDLVRWFRSKKLRIIHNEPFYVGRRQDSEITRLGDGDRPTFFGYHDKTPFSSGGDKVLAMSVKARDDRAESECTPMRVGYFRKRGPVNFENKFITFAETNTWCWQQGCMLQWHPKNPDRELILNKLVNGAYGAAVFDVEELTLVREYSAPIYSLDPGGGKAVTLNLSRLGRLRPGYGYTLLEDTTTHSAAPRDDGLFVLNLQTGEKNLIVSLANLAESGRVKSGRQHYINHATFSPGGKRLLFFHLWTNEDKPGRGLRVCEADPVSGSWSEVESERVVSHYCWKDDSRLLATTLDRFGSWQYSLYDLNKKTRKDLHLPLDCDGHPMFHPLDKNVIVTDTYPDARSDQHLCVIDISVNEVREIATLHTPQKYRGQVRCDLHPRWDREGRYVAVDSTSSGKRTLLLVKAE